jgi:endoglucanase
VYLDEWGSLRHAANVAFIALQAADLGIKADEYRAFAKSQIGYALGDTGRSFVVGYGVNPPERPHHRGASCPNRPSPCDFNNGMNNPGPNFQTLYGALVGGPGSNDDYVDDRGDFRRNEVATDYNAGFQGALAALQILKENGQLP